ncbi:MAG: hypothetical protein C0391_00575 [Anaerolinea sp.]|nr:hypothetical protein [Anaerolinea sp.]
MLSILPVLLPVIVIFLLLILRRTPADIAGLIGFVRAGVVAARRSEAKIPVFCPGRLLTAGLSPIHP